MMANTFVYEIPDFFEEAKIFQAVSPGERKFLSESYSLAALNLAKVTGRITVEKVGYPGTIQIRNELSIIRPNVNSSRRTFSVADVIKGKISLEVKTADGKLIERYDKYKSMFLNETTGMITLEVGMAKVMTAIEKDPSSPKDVLARVITSIAVAPSHATFMGNELLSTDVSAGTVLPYAESLAKRDLTDLTIHCGGKEFPVHSLILQSISPVFPDMMKTEVKGGDINIEDVQPEALEEMLEFIYAGNFKTGDPIPDELLIPLLQCADKFDFALFNKKVVTAMGSQLSVRNAVKYVQAAKTHGADKKVTNEMLQFCKRNLSLFEKDAEFKEFFLENMDFLI